MKLSSRLDTIKNKVTDHYDHIWDCCCDHGQLGVALLASHPKSVIHFVDVVDELMIDLESQLQKHASAIQSQWQVHCMDVAKLPLIKGKKNLIIIAGVGGDLLIELVRSIQTRNSDIELEFILCPVLHNYMVRCELIEMGFGLISETLVKENKRFYEVLHISNQAVKQIAPVGSDMWNLSDSDHQEYLTKTVSHYQRMGGSSENYNNISELYLNLRRSTS
ncbi:MULTISPECIES: tRNA (adenine(22)-N(1))-methyltransferase [Aliivibrio]|uniref:SAM-dependent methyltransferase n=1 Tax=Aliivibrio finisterrensis TaxID=511998 RepID=A0A4Q5KWU4_9GAMM|nr:MULTISPECIES: tRNA (adenine(22)-N(1))-methyltransferase TrmK [Aliivibrio]MDD9178155.1 tRNA (adenine(22)-N(1))-methyltransferase TrmK [Aliivibrio sp. A6]RYU53568.1 SAM-dependent methyltransferase [Aliivibrio finisterrensis]RYU54232.1 SAM-dependent methyltransferase [Aliivibrio finisterrensis]RYU59212.1 SAM-dependent methyltransferase [Aliivibrio finisterrensis]RYU62604.1 SAM-dependent methyltransferase [Aliivibrio finisterrensis]